MLKLEKINKKAGNFSLVDIDFTVGKGDYFTLIGESGAGKSMLLEIIMGIIAPDSGNILLNKKVSSIRPLKNENWALYIRNPHFSPTCRFLIISPIP